MKMSDNRSENIIIAVPKGRILEELIPEYKDRIIFDGYPRNIHQAENLEIILNYIKETKILKKKGQLFH